MATYAALLTEARNALRDILVGRVKSYTFSGQAGAKTVTRLEISDLERHIEWLEGKVAQENRRPITQLASFGGTGT